MMDMIETKVLDHGKKCLPDRKPSEIRDYVIKQVKQITEL